jgi:hypothetical protein
MYDLSVRTSEDIQKQTEEKMNYEMILPEKQLKVATVGYIITGL